MHDQRKIRVLIADESRAQSFLLRQSLEDLGFIVDIDGEIFIEGVEHDIAFLYINNRTVNLLSDMNFRASIRQFNAAIAVLSPTDKHLRSACFASGMSDVLEEPLSTDALYECLCSLSVEFSQKERSTESTPPEYLKICGDHEIYV
jgi:CheY-like chemotaxis protein